MLGPLAPGVYALIAAGWMQHWRTYLEDASAERPPPVPPLRGMSGQVHIFHYHAFTANVGLNSPDVDTSFPQDRMFALLKRVAPLSFGVLDEEAHAPLSDAACTSTSPRVGPEGGSSSGVRGRHVSVQDYGALVKARMEAQVADPASLEKLHALWKHFESLLLRSMVIANRITEQASPVESLIDSSHPSSELVTASECSALQALYCKGKGAVEGDSAGVGSGTVDLSGAVERYDPICPAGCVSAATTTTATLTVGPASELFTGDFAPAACASLSATTAPAHTHKEWQPSLQQCDKFPVDSCTPGQLHAHWDQLHTATGFPPLVVGGFRPPDWANADPYASLGCMPGLSWLLLPAPCALCFALRMAACDRHQTEFVEGTVHLVPFEKVLADVSAKASDAAGAGIRRNQRRARAASTTGRVSLHVAGTTTVVDVMLHVFQRTEKMPSQLYYKGKSLPKSQTLVEAGVRSGDTLQYELASEANTVASWVDASGANHNERGFKGSRLLSGE